MTQQGNWNLTPSSWWPQQQQWAPPPWNFQTPPLTHFGQGFPAAWGPAPSSYDTNISGHEYNVQNAQSPACHAASVGISSLQHVGGASMQAGFTSNVPNYLRCSQPPPWYGVCGFQNTVTESREISETVSEIKSQREQDQETVNEFIDRVLKKSVMPCDTATAKDRNNNVTISECRALIKSCMQMISELRVQHAKLKSTIGNDDYSWYSVAEEACIIKKKIQSVLDNIGAPDKLKNLQNRMKKIRKKRERLRRQKLRYEEEKADEAKNNKLLHEKLDAWLESLRQDYIGAQMEKKMKKEADGILSEVRRKKAEANRTLDLVKAVAKLRAIKKESAKSKGLYTSVESDAAFAAATSKFENVMGCRLKEYGEEERTLQVMLDEEHRETRDLEVRRQQQEMEEKANAVKEDIITSLFGPEAVVGKHDSRYPFWEYYTRADRDLDTLIRVRREWDMFLVAEGAPDSSSVPVGWIRPSKPSSDGWAKVLDRQ